MSALKLASIAEFIQDCLKHHTIMKKFYTMLALATMLVALSSCSRDYDYYRHSDLLGRWEKVSVIEDGREYELVRGEYEQYIFYDNGTGWYQNEMGTRVDFYWDERGYDKVEIRFRDGIIEALYYEFDRGDLILWDTPSRLNGRVFQYTGGGW